MTAFLYKMTCLTNLHVGNGDVNYSIIDNEVELDYVLKEPIIPSSGVKGALLSFAKECKLDKQLIKTVFGDENDERGTYKFLSANLLSRPVRVSEGNKSFANTTSYELIERFNSLCDNFLVKMPKIIISSDDRISTEGIVRIEGAPVKRTEMPESIRKLIPKPIAVIPNADLNEISLPVVARNNLGEKRNLWYEQYVPYNSIFYMIIITPDDVNLLDGSINNKIVQFGGNASIGYGLMKIEQIGNSKDA